MSRADITYHTDLPTLPPPAGPYSQIAAVGGFVFTAGFGPQDPETGAVADDIDGQTRQVLRNVLAALAEHGLDDGDIVKATVHLHDPARDFTGFNAAYREVFSPPYPVRTTVGSQLANILVEVDVVAAMRPGDAMA